MRRVGMRWSGGEAARGSGAGWGRGWCAQAPSGAVARACAGPGLGAPPAAGPALPPMPAAPPCPAALFTLPAAAYSPRPGTPAAVWDGQVADLVKADRLNRLNAVVNRVAEERAQRFLGRELEVLVEGPNPRDPAQVGAGQGAGVGRHACGHGRACSCSPTAPRRLQLEACWGGGTARGPEPPCAAPLQAVGRTRHNKLLYFAGDGEALRGQLVDVRVDRVHAYTLYGSMAG